MFRPRIIPVLLLKKQALVKSVAFKDYTYIGDPINAVRIFNDSYADELVFLDISATKENRSISLEFVKDVGEEANMPFAVGGGIRTLSQIEAIIKAGAEKVILGSSAVDDLQFVKSAADAFGSSTIVVCLDYKKKFLGGSRVYTRNGTQSSAYEPVEFAGKVESMGAGEIIVQSIERDGSMKGYDTELLKQISAAVSIPVTALGGAGSLEHMKQAYQGSYINGLAAGSVFVYHGNTKGVLINYPEKHELTFTRG